MDIQNLVPVDYSNQRVLTTAQVADVFGTTPNVIRENFRYAKKQFQEGVHYFKVTGEALRTLKFQLNETEESVSENRLSDVAPLIPKTANAIILYTVQGCARHCKMLNTPKALERFAELKRDYFQVAETPAVTPSVVEVQDKIGYVDKENVAWLNAELVARGLGFVQVEEKESFATSGEFSTTNGRKTYSTVRWARVNGYLREFGYDKEVGKGDYLPENMVYRLAMKANSETAKVFQDKFAEEIAQLKAEKRMQNSVMPFEVQDKVGYIDKENVAWLNAEFVARGLGFVQEKGDRVPNFGDKYSAVRWERVNQYLAEFGYSQKVGKGDYLPENMVYRLAMKANNDRAVDFQIKIANEIMPSIRKYGCYSVKGEMSLFPDEPTAQKKVRRPAPECALVYAVLLSNLLVKIGLSSDFNRRLKELRKETHCDILEWATTTMLPFLNAVKFEKSCKDKFFANNVGGEFFNTPFAQVKAALQASPVDKLLEIAREMEPSPEKNIILNQAATIILSKKK